MSRLPKSSREFNAILVGAERFLRNAMIAFRPLYRLSPRWFFERLNSKLQEALREIFAPEVRIFRYP
jgi:hypothetical protein